MVVAQARRWPSRLVWRSVSVGGAVCREQGHGGMRHSMASGPGPVGWLRTGGVALSWAVHCSGVGQVPAPPGHLNSPLRGQTRRCCPRIPAGPGHGPGTGSGRCVAGRAQCTGSEPRPFWPFGPHADIPLWGPLVCTRNTAGVPIPAPHVPRTAPRGGTRPVSTSPGAAGAWSSTRFPVRRPACPSGRGDASSAAFEGDSYEAECTARRA